MAEPSQRLVVDLPAQSVATYVFKIANEDTSVSSVTTAAKPTKEYYDLQGRRLVKPRGLCIERYSDGTSKKVYVQ